MRIIGVALVALLATTARGEGELKDQPSRAAMAKLCEKGAKRIKVAETEQRELEGEWFILSGAIDISSAFIGEYRDYEDVAFAFQIRDGTGVATAYLPRTDPRASALRKHLADAVGGLNGSFLVRINPAQADPAAPLCVDLMAFAPPLGLKYQDLADLPNDPALGIDRFNENVARLFGAD